MTRTHYLRPIAMMPPNGPAGALALPLAGQPHAAFTRVELIERNKSGAGVPRLVAGDAKNFDKSLKQAFANLSSPRPDYAGLSMDRPRIMGIVNVTPDSFSDGGRLKNADAAVAHALTLESEGADILDIGGESTRPGSDAVALEDELERVIPVIKALRAKTKARISVDTRKAEVMRQAAEAGADILNDVSAFTHDPKSLSVAAKSSLPIMLMHAQGDPKTMNDNPHYDDVVLDVYDYLETRIAAAESAGIPKSKIVVDPGIGFGKHLPHNVAVLNAMSLYHGLGVPLLLGASRKKLIGQLCNVDDARERVYGSIAAALSSIAQGVQIVRVHDVAATRQAVCVWQAVSRGSEANR